VSWSIKRLVSAMGVPDDVIAQMEQPMMPPGMLPQGGAPVSGDNPNPNPAPPSPTGAGVVADVSGGEA